MEEIRKAQAVRLFDVFVLGPSMVLSAKQSKGEYLPLLMLMGGLGTIFYNGFNYVRIEQLKKGINDGDSNR